MYCSISLNDGRVLRLGGVVDCVCPSASGEGTSPKGALHRPLPVPCGQDCNRGTLHLLLSIPCEPTPRCSNQTFSPLKSPAQLSCSSHLISPPAHRLLSLIVSGSCSGSLTSGCRRCASFGVRAFLALRFDWLSPAGLEHKEKI